MDAHLSKVEAVRNGVMVVIGVVAALAVGRVTGLSDLASYSLRRWPEIQSRQCLIFPGLLVLGLVAVRFVSAVRTRVLAASAAGACVGVAAGVLALAIAQAWEQESRARLLNGLGLDPFWSVVTQVALSLLTLNWLYGALASVIAVLAERWWRNLRLRKSRSPRREGLDAPT